MVSVPPAARHSMPLFIQHGHNSHFTDCVNLDAARAAVEEQAASESDGMLSRGLTALVTGSIWLGQSIQSYASQIINRPAADPTLTPSDSQSIDLQVDGPGRIEAFTMGALAVKEIVSPPVSHFQFNPLAFPEPATAPLAFRPSAFHHPAPTHPAFGTSASNHPAFRRPSFRPPTFHPPAFYPKIIASPKLQGNAECNYFL